jgi:hypothetical protein
MKKIATHDSATGEKGLWWCLPIAPFAKTQSKTIKEQYEAGCRVFDIRVKLYKGRFRCAHGIWLTKKYAEDIFKELNELDGSIVTITYEGNSDNVILFQNFIKYLKLKYPLITYGYTAIKYGKHSSSVNVKYNILEQGEYNVSGKQGFLPLDGRSWHTYLPIPWLWKKIYNNKTEFNEDHYIYVDFL